ncbi:dynein heavy chain domain-containing protein 1 isoform X4 [Melanotaenia boesemani]|uniref:dynein heavy chain domain-containing protein 1 isoform X4 n=1 Tax=Melanotaenia boesemani TaxID=1250792 RepID=UPI001C04C96F|nr:dynein heavy chain domain-containing protein 1 isoform X4 [Melanotaenia boesemani]
MFAAFSKERSSDGSPHTSDKDIANSKPKVEKKVNSSEVTLPPLRPEPSCFSVAKPLFSCGPILKNVPSNESLSVLELPNPFAQVGPGRAMAHAKWTGRPQLLPSAFKTAIPIRATQSKGQSLTEKEDSVKVTTCKNKKIRTDGRATKSKKHPLTGTEVVEMFAQKRDPGDLEFYYLKERDGDTYRPYDLQVISSSDAGSEHYIFSPDTVLHVTKTGFGGLVSLAEWNREYVLWTALQKIPFFRDFRPRKAFAWWQKNVHMILFNRRCKNLQDMLLLAVPQFRNALHLFTGIIEELKETHWMPLDDSKTYTLLEFRTEMIKKSQECFLILEKLAQYHAVVLNMVKDESYRTHKELQLHIKLANRPNRSYEPIHLHLAYQHELKKELHQSERILQKLGNFAALVHQMIVQSVVTIIQQDAISFLSRLKKMASQQCCLFHTELCFSESSQLTMDPPVHMFQETVSECLLTAGNSVIQMCDSCGLFQEISSNAHSSVQDLISDLSCMKLSGEKNSDRRIGHSFREMSAHQLALPEATVLMVQSNMMHGSYYPLSKTQLEWQICINDITKEVEIEQAKIMQAEELEIQQLCKSYAWLGDIHLFVTQWSPVSLESMKGQPASVYEEHIKKLRSWAERINTVDASVYTSNQMFIIHCTHTKVTLGQQLNLIEQQVLHQLVEQMKLRTESLILVLEGVTAALKKEPQVLQDFSKYAFRVRETSKMLTDLEKSLEYNVSLRNTICTTYRKMTEQELTLEEKMLDLWNSFIVLLKQADSLVRQRLPLMANALETKFSLLAFELKNIVFKATSGPFLDQCQNASEIVPKLNHMCAHVQALYEELKQLNRNSESIQEQTIDLTNITADVQKVIARKDLWQLKAEYTTWVEEWKQQLFSEVVVSEALGKTFKWKKQAQILTSSIPTDDTVLQETLGVLEDLSHQTEVMVKLHSTKLREKHWEAIFQGMGLLYIPEKQVTVDEIMSQQLKAHQKLINKICRDAQTEWNMEQTFQKICLHWKDRVFQLSEFTLHLKEKHTEGIISNVHTARQRSCNDSRFTITGLETHSAEVENDLITLSTILMSGHSDVSRLQLEDWIQSLQEVAKLLDLFERYQQMWAFLTRMFKEKSCCDQRLDLKIILASEIQLQHAVRQREISDEAKVSAASHTNHMPLENMPVQLHEDRKETVKISKLRSSQLSVIWALMEETALVKAIISVLIPEHKKASEFYIIFKDTFPLACQFPLFQQYIEEGEKIKLENAVKEELQQTCLYCDNEIICNALKLYQAVKISHAVMLIGPSGSGKTACYRALAGALNRLAFQQNECVFENENTIQKNTSQAGPKIFASNWCFIHTLVLFPNAMSHDELFGCFCEKKGWKDGAVAKVLEECDRRCSEICNNEGKSSRTSTVKWLVMDGEPAGKPGWLDYLTTLCTSQDPFLCLSSGKTLPSQSHLNLLMEMTDLQNASPSAVTHCSLVYFMGTELWKAVWKSEINVLSCEHKLDQGIVKMWSRLAEDLFHSTLSLLGQNALTSANHFERGSCKRYGLQEIMSFVRILRAFLQHFVAHLKTHKTTPQTDKRDETNTRGTDTQSKQELLCRNLFLVAYIWGFGGHLHSRHWPQFDLLARQVLFNCRYKIEVPDEESVFEHFDISSKMCSKDTQLTNSIIPKYGKYKRLLSLMLAANQPVLITGEPASGKTTLCKTFLSFDKPHINLPASPLLSSKDLRIILKSICILKNCKDAAGSRRKQPGLLLFVDDLHEAPCDVYGKASMALETLRQSISKGGILTFDTCFFSLLSSGTVSYLTTCCVSGLGNQCSNVISLRLSRLFSIFVLPSHSTDVILSIHSQRLKIWLREMPLNYNSEDMSKCVITATKDLYHAVCGQFQPTALRPHFRFSYHDLQKVFLGMFLSQSDISTTETMHKNQKLQSNPFLALSGPPASVINIIHLWMHECMRTFSDRLCTEDERKTFLSLLVKTATTHFESKLVDNTYLDTFDDPSTVRNQVVHILPVNKTSICQTKVQNVELNNLTEEPKPIGPSDLSQKGHALTESSLESETSSSEDGKTHPLQPTILQLLEDLMAKLVYGPESFETLNSLNQLHKNKSGCCYQEQNLDALLLELCALLDRKEEDKTKRVDSLFAITNRYFVHREAVSQLLHILRALFIPGGHGVLIGSDRGTGRKTTVRLAAYLTGFQLMEVCSDNENKLHEILKEAGNRAIVDGVNVIILVHEEVSPPVREELLVAMAQRAYPALFTEDELQKLVSTVTAVKHSRRYLMDKWMSENNIHVFLLMPFNMSDNSELPANNETQSWIAQMAKALRLSCCVEVYQPWSNLSLVEVAVKCLKICPNKIIQECSEHSLTVAMAGIHQSACQYASAFLRAQPFSPRTYMEFISHFGYLCNQLHEQWQSKTSRVAKALARLEVLNNTAVQCKQHLTQLQTKISKTQQHEKELLRTVEDHKNLLDRALEKYIEKQKHLEEKINQAQQQMKPVFLSYLKIFECLNSSDLEEVRHYRDPPDGVVKIMDALCLLFNRPPGWESAKQLLGQSNFFQELEFFDCSSLTNEQLQQLGQIVQSPHFLSDSVREVSKACESLCRWVQAVYEGCYEQHQLVVKQQIEVLVGEARSQLNLARQHKKEAYQRYEDVNLHLKFVQEDLEEQLLQLREAENQESEAATCAEKLQMHIRDWRAACLEAELRCQNIPGDALILAAVMSYLGPFGPEVRTELLSKWRELCQTGIINKNPKDIRSSLFTQTDIKPISPSLGFPITVTEKLQLPLGQALGLNEWQLEDTLSTRLLVKLLLWGFTCSYTQCWPLLADIEQYLEKTSQNKLITGENEKLEKEFMFGMVVCADDLELLDKLDHAAEKGLKVLVTHVERAIPSPGFLAKLARPSECCFPGLQQPPQLLHPDFCLFLSTHLPVSLLNSAIHASILARVHVVDLSLSSEEIQELMLTQLLQSECRDLLIQHLRFQNNNQVLQEKLVTEEVAVMDYILQSDNFLLKDRYFLSHVAVCQEEIKKLQTEVKQLSEELEHHDSLLAAPRQLMKLAAALYQALQAMSRLSPAYYFSLIGFITVMQEVFRVKGRLLVSDTTGKATKNMLPETMNMMVLQLLVLYRPRLFKRHAVVLKLLVSLALLKYNQLCSEAEILAFLSGFEDTEHIITEACSSSITISHSSGGLPSWIPPHIHSGLLCLEKIPTFRGLIASLCASPTQWHEYLCLPSCTVVGTVPCRSHSHLSLLQRALLWKTILPNSLEELADVIVASQLCLPVKTNWTDFPDTGNIEALSKYLVKYERLVILTLPNPEKDMQMSIQPLYLINQLAHCAKEKNKVQVKIISFGALCDRELILSMLDKAVHDGHWLVLNNCHLLEHWDDEVLARISWLISSFTEEQSPIHPCFRLWFITQENASHFVPAAVRMCALPLVCDSPWDLKEELSCSLRQVMSVSRLQSWSDVTTNNMELLLRCAIFHSILLQRQAYKYLCCGRIHHWSQDDLLALADAHICIASLCNDNTKVLQYIAVNLIHGGHVMDSADLEVVESVAKSCFGTVSSFLGRGPHTLTNVTSSCDRFDLSRPLQVLEPCFQHSTISDPVLLGLSEDVPSEITKINSHNLNLLLKASQPSLGQVKRFSTRQEQFPKLPAYSHTKERLETLKNYLTHKKGSTVKEVESVSHSPIRDFLMAEWDDLTNLVSLLLTKLQQPVQYTMSVSPLFNCTDLSHLEKRADLLSAYLWHGSTSDPPGAYRLSAFKNPRGFLVAVMKEAAQINHRYISDIMLHFQVLCDCTYPALLPPGAVYLCGLELKGASWDSELEALQDTLSPLPVSMPLLCVKAQFRSPDTATDTLSCKSSYLMNKGNVQAAGASPVTPTQLPIYHCPLYVNTEQKSGNWGLTEVNIISVVPLRANLNPVLCSLRRVRLVSIL